MFATLISLDGMLAPGKVLCYNIEIKNRGDTMDFKVLAVGDVVGGPGMDRVRRSLRNWKQKCGADFVIVNGENAAVLGMTPQQAEDIFDAGADVITMGNHTFAKREIVPYMEDNSRILRPANYAPQTPGVGYGVYETACGPVAVIDLQGRVDMDYTPDNPFASSKLSPVINLTSFTYCFSDFVNNFASTGVFFTTEIGRASCRERVFNTV